MESVILLAIGMIVGAWFLYLVQKVKRELITYRIEKEIREKVDKLKEKIIPSRIEESNGILFLYNSETNEFLGQGTDAESLEVSVKSRYPGKLFNVPQDQLDKYFKET